MKKLAFMLILFVIVAIISSSFADIVYIPRNPFYKTHQHELIPSDREYEAATDTNLYTEPNGEKGEKISSGETVTVKYIWRNRWGLLYWTDQWVDLRDFRMLYNIDDFSSDHSAEFIKASGKLVLSDSESKSVLRIVWETVPEEYEEQFGQLSVEGTTFIYFWSFPESGRVVRGFSLEAFDMFCRGEKSFGPVFIDSQKRVWARVYNDGYQQVDGWICLSNLSEELPAEETKYADKGMINSVANDRGNGGTGLNNFLPPAIAVILTTILTAVLLIIMNRKHRIEGTTKT